LRNAPSGVAWLKNIGFGLVGLFFFLYLVPLNVRQLSVPDEFRYGEIAREMLASGDFIVPRLDGLRYFEKPAGGHVLNAVAMAVFGETNFAVRLMSAISVGLSAAGLYFLLKCCSTKRTAALAAFIFLTTGMVFGIGTFSVLDSMLSCFITLSLCSFYPALEASGKRRIGLLALAGVFAGGAFLVKGFIAGAVIVVVIVPFLMYRRRWKDILTLPWIPLVAAMAVSLPWCLAIAIREPDFWRYFFWEEHVRRFFSDGRAAQHSAPFWHYVPILIGGAIPWSFIGPLPFRDLIRNRSGDPLIQFGLSWLLMPFIFFSCSSGKLGTYILPCFVPFALLLSVALADRLERNEKNRSLQVGAWIMATMSVAAMVVTLVVGGLHSLDQLPQLDEHFVAKFFGWVAGLSIAIFLAIVAVRESRGLWKTACLGFSASAMFVTAIACLPMELSPSLGIQGVLESEQHHVEPDTILVATPKAMLAVCYVFKRADVCLFRDKSELAYGLSYPDAQHCYLDVAGLNAMLQQRRDRRVILTMRADLDDSIRTQLPPPSYQRQWLNVWFAVFEPRTDQ
jgi:4-amino-4-deoxy-L-arabinose transferase